MPSDPTASHGAASFSEKSFYLGELRDHTLAIAGRTGQLRDRASLEPVLVELESNQTRVVLISDTEAALEGLLGTPVLSVGDPATLPGRAWRCLRTAPRVGVVTDAGHGFAASCRQIVLELGIGKLVWADEGGGLLQSDGRRDSFIDAEGLRARMKRADDVKRADLLVEIEIMLSAGVRAVNLCAIEGVGAELFTYAGAGTLFTGEGYVSVRRLALDDFDAAADLIERGIAEGYLAPRSPEEVERVLESGFGAFVGGNHLAGIGTLLIHETDSAGEIASLYTLTRFVGEGIGGYLVRHAMERARQNSCEFVFACTTADRVVSFFERNGFERVDSEQVPAAKWHAYDPERRAEIRCLRRNVVETAD